MQVYLKGVIVIPETMFKKHYNCLKWFIYLLIVDIKALEQSKLQCIAWRRYEALGMEIMASNYVLKVQLPKTVTNLMSVHNLIILTIL